MNEPSAPLRTFDPFRVLTPDERRHHLDAYLGFLRERDGERDLAKLTLSQRERYFRDLEAKPVRWQGDIDESGFYQHLRGSGRPEIDPRTVLLTIAAKSNLGEAYGTELELRTFARHPERASHDPLYLHLMLEERYHTRILEEVCRTGGVEPEQHLPPRFLRTLIHAMMYLPDRLRWIAIFAGEVLGSEVFNVLRGATHAFSDDPEVEARLAALLREIWIDEVFHVAYLRAKVGPLGMRVARVLVPIVASSVFAFVPQSEKIGLTRREVLDRVRRGIEIPPGMDWMPADPRGA